MKRNIKGQPSLIWLAALAALTLTTTVSLLRRKMRADARRLRVESRFRQRAVARARWLSNHDAYTELPRLHHFLEQADKRLNDATSEAGQVQIVAVRISDLDKTIRTLGHEIGLTAFRQFARRLKLIGLSAVGRSRDIFLLCGNKVQIDACFSELAAAANTLAKSGRLGPRMYAGAATWPQDGHTVADLLRRAEAAMALAEKRHEGWVDYGPGVEPDEGDVQLVELFRTNGGADIYPAFQAQIDVRSGAVVGAEVLARWDPPGFGQVSPNRFIPLLERAGLIRHITARMIAEAVRMSVRLRKGGCACPISVNVAVADLVSDEVRETVVQALDLHGGVVGDLKLELTQISAAEELETVRDVMTKLRNSGVALSIDDYGTGYSSLSYLSNLPIQEVKIDRSFILDIDKRIQSQSVVRSTIAMGHELGLIVLAEGVESEEALDFLRRNNCDRAQGFLISRPLLEADFLAFLAASKPANAAVLSL